MNFTLLDAIGVANQSEEGRHLLKLFLEADQRNKDQLAALCGADGDTTELISDYINTQRSNERRFIARMERKRGEKTPRFVTFEEEDEIKVETSPRSENQPPPPRGMVKFERDDYVAPEPPQPMPEVNVPQHSSASLQLAYVCEHKLTSDTPQKEVPIGAVLKNNFPTPTTDRSRDLLTLDFLADVASYWGHTLYITFVASTLMSMAMSYLPITELDEALKEVSEFIGLISEDRASETRAALNKLKCFLGKLWDASARLASSKRKNKNDNFQTHLDFRNSYWVKEASDETLRALGFTY